MEAVHPTLPNVYVRIIPEIFSKANIVFQIFQTRGTKPLVSVLFKQGALSNRRRC